MTIPTFVMDWLKANGFELSGTAYEIYKYEKKIDKYQHSEEVIVDRDQLLYDGNLQKFEFCIPSNEQDFLTLINILLK